MSDYETLGEYRVGVSFNPSHNPAVDKIKHKAAALIDLINELPLSYDGECIRLQSKAMTCVEEAAMWAVKAATKQARKQKDHGQAQA